MSPRDNICSWFHFYLLLGWKQFNVYTVTAQILVWLSFYNISRQFYVLLFYVSDYFKQFYICSFQCYFKQFYFCSFQCQVFCLSVRIDTGIVGSRGSLCAVDVSPCSYFCTAWMHQTAELWLGEKCSLVHFAHRLNTSSLALPVKAWPLHRGN